MNAKRIEIMKQLKKANDGYARAYDSGNSKMLRFWEAKIANLMDQLDAAGKA